MVYPGTEAYEWAKEHHYIKASGYADWLKTDGMHNCVLNTESLTAEEMVAFCDYARKKFYLRPKYILMKAEQCLTSKEDFVRTIKAFRTFRKYLFKKG